MVKKHFLIYVCSALVWHSSRLQNMRRVAFFDMFERAKGALFIASLQSLSSVNVKRAGFNQNIARRGLLKRV